MPLMNAVARPALAPLKTPASGGRVSLDAKLRPIGAVASADRASASDPSRGCVTLKTVAAATAVGLCLSLTAARGAVRRPPRSWARLGPEAPRMLAFHHRGRRRPRRHRRRTAPTCANGETQRPWSLPGQLMMIPSARRDPHRLLPQGRAQERPLGRSPTRGGILFPDGNTWSRHPVTDGDGAKTRLTRADGDELSSCRASLLFVDDFSSSQFRNRRARPAEHPLLKSPTRSPRRRAMTESALRPMRDRVGARAVAREEHLAGSISDHLSSPFSRYTLSLRPSRCLTCLARVHAQQVTFPTSRRLEPAASREDPCARSARTLPSRPDRRRCTATSSR